MKDNGHIKLLGHDNNTITYLNDDGTKTIYVSSAPIEERKLCLRESDKNYESKGRNIDVSLPKKLNGETGISVGEFINVYPPLDTEHISEFKHVKNVFGQIKECVKYKGVYKDLSLYCYATSFGLNSEIVIPEYSGENIYSVKIKQPKGLFIEEETDYVLFRDEEDLRSMIFTSLAVDSNGVWNYNNRVILALAEDGECYVHFVIDEDFLKSADTKYPVTINQSINAYKHKQPDTSLYSKTEDSARHYLSPYMLLGKETVKGEGWALIRYEVLEELDVKAENVLKAEYYVSNLCKSESVGSIGTYAITDDWCSVNTRWKSRPTYEDVPIHVTKVRSTGVYGVDITRLFKDMIRNRGEYEPRYSVRNSFLIKNDNSKGSTLLLGSGDLGMETPYLKVVVKQ